MNESQTKLFIFRPRRKLNLTATSINLNNFIITPEKIVTYLGIEIDENLSWHKRIKILAKKISRTNYILLKIRYYVQKKTLTSISYSLFKSYITYGSKIWFFMSQKICEKYFCSSVKCIRLLIFSDYHEHTSLIFKPLKVLKVQDIIQFSIL